MRPSSRRCQNQTGRPRRELLLLLLLLPLLLCPVSFYCGLVVVVDAAFSSRSSSNSLISSRKIIDTTKTTATKATISKPAGEQFTLYNDGATREPPQDEEEKGEPESEQGHNHDYDDTDDETSADYHVADNFISSFSSLEEEEEEEGSTRRRNEAHSSSPRVEEEGEKEGAHDKMDDDMFVQSQQHSIQPVVPQIQPPGATRTAPLLQNVAATGLSVAALIWLSALASSNGLNPSHLEASTTTAAAASAVAVVAPWQWAMVGGCCASLASATQPGPLGRLMRAVGTVTLETAILLQERLASSSSSSLVRPLGETSNNKAAFTATDVQQQQDDMLHVPWNPFSWLYQDDMLHHHLQPKPINPQKGVSRKHDDSLKDGSIETGAPASAVIVDAPPVPHSHSTGHALWWAQEITASEADPPITKAKATTPSSSSSAATTVTTTAVRPLVKDDQIKTAMRKVEAAIQSWMENARKPTDAAGQSYLVEQVPGIISDKIQQTVIAPIVSGPLLPKHQVPGATLAGAALSTSLMAMSCTDHNVAVSGILGLVAAFAAVTSGPVGTTLRTAGAWTHETSGFITEWTRRVSHQLAQDNYDGEGLLSLQQWLPQAPQSQQQKDEDDGWLPLTAQDLDQIVVGKDPLQQQQQQEQEQDSPDPFFTTEASIANEKDPATPVATAVSTTMMDEATTPHVTTVQSSSSLSVTRRENAEDLVASVAVENPNDTITRVSSDVAAKRIPDDVDQEPWHASTGLGPTTTIYDEEIVASVSQPNNEKESVEEALDQIVASKESIPVQGRQDSPVVPFFMTDGSIASGTADGATTVAAVTSTVLPEVNTPSAVKSPSRNVPSANAVKDAAIEKSNTATSAPGNVASKELLETSSQSDVDQEDWLGSIGLGPTTTAMGNDDKDVASAIQAVKGKAAPATMTVNITKNDPVAFMSNTTVRATPEAKALNDEPITTTDVQQQFDQEGWLGSIGLGPGSTIVEVATDLPIPPVTPTVENGTSMTSPNDPVRLEATTVPNEDPITPVIEEQTTDVSVTKGVDISQFGSRERHADIPVASRVHPAHLHAEDTPKSTPVLKTRDPSIRKPIKSSTSPDDMDTKAWEETSQKDEMARRSLLAYLSYRLTMQNDERTLRAIAEAVEVSIQKALKASKQNELTRRSLLKYQLKLQGDERSQRAITNALKASDQKALVTSKQNELTHRSLLAYQLKLQGEEQILRVIAEALKTSKQNELTRRSLLEYRLTLQGEERSQRDMANALKASNRKALGTSKQSELTHRSLLAYQLKLQGEEQIQRAIAEAIKTSKQNELTRRSLLEYRLRMQADQRNRRTAAEALEASKQKARVVSIRSEWTHRSLLAYRLKLEGEERAQRVNTEALQKSEQKDELVRRSLLEYRMTLQNNERTQRGKSVEEQSVPTSTAPKAEVAHQTSQSSFADVQQLMSQKQESLEVQVPFTGKGQATTDTIAMLGGTDSSPSIKTPAQNLLDATCEKTEKGDTHTTAPSHDAASTTPKAMSLDKDEVQRSLRNVSSAENLEAAILDKPSASASMPTLETSHPDKVDQEAWLGSIGLGPTIATTKDDNDASVIPSIKENAAQSGSIKKTAPNPQDTMLDTPETKVPEDEPTTSDVQEFDQENWLGSIGLGSASTTVEAVNAPSRTKNGAKKVSVTSITRDTAPARPGATPVQKGKPQASASSGSNLFFATTEDPKSTATMDHAAVLDQLEKTWLAGGPDQDAPAKVSSTKGGGLNSQCDSREAKEHIPAPRVQQASSFTEGIPNTTTGETSEPSKSESKSSEEDRITIQANVQTESPKAVEAPEVLAVATASNARGTMLTMSPSTLSASRDQVPQKQKSVEVEVPVAEKGQSTADSIATLGIANTSPSTKSPLSDARAKAAFVVEESATAGSVPQDAASARPEAIGQMDDKDEGQRSDPLDWIGSVALGPSVSTQPPENDIFAITSGDGSGRAPDPIVENGKVIPQYIDEPFVINGNAEQRPLMETTPITLDKMENTPLHKPEPMLDTNQYQPFDVDHGAEEDTPETGSSAQSHTNIPSLGGPDHGKLVDEEMKPTIHATAVTPKDGITEKSVGEKDSLKGKNRISSMTWLDAPQARSPAFVVDSGSAANGSRVNPLAASVQIEGLTAARGSDSREPPKTNGVGRDTTFSGHTQGTTESAAGVQSEGLTALTGSDSPQPPKISVDARDEAFSVSNQCTTESATDVRIEGLTAVTGDDSPQLPTTNGVAMDETFYVNNECTTESAASVERLEALAMSDSPQPPKTNGVARDETFPGNNQSTTESTVRVPIDGLTALTESDSLQSPKANGVACEEEVSSPDNQYATARHSIARPLAQEHVRRNEMEHERSGAVDLTAEQSSPTQEELEAGNPMGTLQNQNVAMGALVGKSRWGETENEEASQTSTSRSAPPKQMVSISEPEMTNDKLKPNIPTSHVVQRVSVKPSETVSNILASRVVSEIPLLPKPVVALPQPEVADDKIEATVPTTLALPINGRIVQGAPAKPSERVANILASRIVSGVVAPQPQAVPGRAPVKPSNTVANILASRLVSGIPRPKPAGAAPEQKVTDEQGDEVPTTAMAPPVNGRIVPRVPPVKQPETVANLLASRVAAARPRRRKVPAPWVVAPLLPPDAKTTSQPNQGLSVPTSPVLKENGRAGAKAQPPRPPYWAKDKMTGKIFEYRMEAPTKSMVPLLDQQSIDSQPLLEAAAQGTENQQQQQQQRQGNNGDDNTVNTVSLPMMAQQQQQQQQQQQVQWVEK